MDATRIGIIGGSGLYDMDGLKETRSSEISTPFGQPSGPYLQGTLSGVPLVFLPRHGKGHVLTPSEINYRANIWGMKKLGVTHLISVSAVGSMKEDIPPGKLVFIDQFIDRTRLRPATFFGDGIVAHANFADPISLPLARRLAEIADELDLDSQYGGTYLCMEGPQFSTRAESRLYRQWGVDVIGMTNLTEAKLAREAEIAFATIALATDYDCWHESEGDVQIEEVLKVMAQNVASARKILVRLAQTIQETPCPCDVSMKDSIVTARDAIPAEARERVEILVGKYL